MSTKVDWAVEKRARSGSEGPGSSKQQSESQGQGYAQRYHGSKAWWSVGEFLHQGITHQSVGLSLGPQDEESWDLSDSLADLYQAVTQRQRKEASKVRTHTRSGSHGASQRVDTEKLADIKRWLDDDTSHGFIRVFASDSDNNARLFPCTLSTSAQKICLQMAIPGNSLHVQLSGDVIRRMEPFDCPLAIQNEYLAGLGYSDIRCIQEEGPKEELAFLVRFYAGKPLSDYTYARNQLSTYAYVRKGKLLHQWARRLCVLSGTRLLIYRDKGSEPTPVQLAKGAVEEVQVKGQSLVLKLTSTLQGERSLYLSFVNQDDYTKWLRKIKKATAKLPTKVDLSSCQLEFLPETVFINTDLHILTLRHNALRERPIEEDIYTIGWLDDLPRFTALRSLNLSDNQLSSFPMSLCEIRSLMELNLASNKLEDIPSQIADLVNLQVLHLHNNMLSSLPEELANMRNLSVVVLAFNRFVHIPTVLLQSQHASFKLDSVIMAGNQISRLPADQLQFMTHIKKVDLRLNRLQLLPTETARFHSLEHITHVDIRENQVTDLDIRAIRCMEYLNCERNGMRSMQVNGSSLKNLFASHNSIQTLSINPKPEWLVSMDISHNKLTELPSWLPDCFFLIQLDVSHNLLKTLPDRLLTDMQKLKIMKATHNRLVALPDRIRSDTLEELHLQHNFIRYLSTELFIKAHRLRYLNMTRNKLCDLPAPNRNDSFNKLQELYLSFNHLGNRAVHKVCCFPRLRVLHMARNKFSVLEETDMEKLEQLTELNVSFNNLTYLPAALGRHPRLQVLRANCNLLQELPNFRNSSGLKVLEVSSNHLVNVNMANLMASQVSLLDISANPSVLVKSDDLQAARDSKRLCMLDMRGQNLSREDVRSREDKDDGLPWQTGLSQTSGIRNKLSVNSLNKPQLNDKGEALFGVFDGGRNDAVSSKLCDILPSVLREERAKSKEPEQYLKYCMLSAHRNLQSQGQKLGAAAAVVHLWRDDRGQQVLSVANVGDTQVVLCRHRRAYLLSRPFLVREDKEDTGRIVRSGGIITEDGRVAGVTYNTRMLGCSYLYPHVIPDPHVTSVTLTPDDTFFLVANQGLWQYVTHEEAVREIKDIPDPVVAAKRLQDLAQGYGSRENIAVLVVRLMLTSAERSRVRDLLRTQRKGQKELLKVLSQQGDLLELRDGVPKVAELSGVVIDKCGHAKKHRSSRKHLLEATSEETAPGVAVGTASEHARMSTSQSSPTFSPGPAGRDEMQMRGERNSHKNLRRMASEDISPPLPPRNEKRLYKKKSSGSVQSSWETLMKKRISEEVKVKELRQTFDDDDDDDDDYDDTENQNGFSSDDEDIFTTSMPANWTASRPKKKAERPEEWEEQLQHRLTQELVSRELRKAVEKDTVLDHGLDADVDTETEGENWATRPKGRPAGAIVDSSAGGILSRHITRPPQVGQDGNMVRIMEEEAHSEMRELTDDEKMISAAESMDSIRSDILRMMANSSHNQGGGAEEGFPVHGLDEMSPSEGIDLSPCESVSSIDVRLHNEADEIYRLRHQGPLTPSLDHEMTLQANTEHHDFQTSDVGDSMGEMYTRPLSPDSLISMDEFVKPPVNNVNIDRDALLFHQMQMARAQAHAGSSASLDSIQSAPLHSSSKDIGSNVRASSHSIEVLVNLGEDKFPASSHSDDTQAQKSHSTQGGHVTWGSSLEKTFQNGSSDLSSSREANADSKSDVSTNSLISRPNTGVVKTQFEPDTSADKMKAGNIFEEDENDDEDDRDTLVGDDGDIGGDVDSELSEPVEGRREEEICLKKDMNVVASAQNTVHVNGKSEEDADNGDDDDGHDSDSDESIGNVSLEDGYTAIEFNRKDTYGSVSSMLNVLTNEADQYPDLQFQAQGKKAAPKKPVEEKEKEDSGDYETIDDPVAGEVKDERNRVTSYQDDVNPYEDVNYDLEIRELEAELPKEEDIDALYAKVNKIKMEKIRGVETQEGNFPSLLPSGLRDPSRAPHATSGSSAAASVTTTMKVGEHDKEENEEREIFISGTPLHSSEVSRPKAIPRYPSQPQGHAAVPRHGSPSVFKKPPPNVFGLLSSSSSSSSSVKSPSPTTTTTIAHPCNTPTSSAPPRPSLDPYNGAKVIQVDLSSSPSFTPGLQPSAFSPPVHSKDPSQQPRVEPSTSKGSKKTPAPKAPSLAGALGVALNSSAKPDRPSPVQPVSVVTPPRPPLPYSRAPPPLPPKPSVMSYPPPLPPKSPSVVSYPSSSIELSPAASKLPTQRSIIITYL